MNSTLPPSLSLLHRSLLRTYAVAGCLVLTPGLVAAQQMLDPGGNNLFSLEPGFSHPTGVQAPGSGNTLVLQGAGNGSFAVSSIVPVASGGAQEFGGFNQFEKNGVGTWTLTGFSTELTPWTIRQGVLSISADGRLGDSAGSLTLAGGTLQVANGNAVMDRQVIVTPTGGTLDVESGRSLTLNTGLQVDGMLSKSGGGTLHLNEAGTFADELLMRINGGLVNVTKTGALGTNTTVVVSGPGLQGNGLALVFADASAESLVIQHESSSTVSFQGSATAASAQIDVLGPSSELSFTDTASAGQARINNMLGSGRINFYGDSTADQSTLVLSGTQTRLSFNDNATAGTATITSYGGLVSFFNTSVAGGANISLQAGASASFRDDSSAAGARISTSADSVLHARFRTAGGETFSVGSLNGNGEILLGAADQGGAPGTPVTLEVGARNEHDVYAGAIGEDVQGASLRKEGTGTLTLDGANLYTGLTTVAQGGLYVGGAANSLGRVAGDVAVLSGATLGGHGRIWGDTHVASGAVLAPGARAGAGRLGTLTVQGDLTLAQGSAFHWEAGAPGLNGQTPGTSDSVVVGRNLALQGATLDIRDAGGLGNGLYRVFDYDGTLTLSNGGLALAGASAGAAVQFLSGDKQINLLISNGGTLNFWNANGLADGTRQGGGSGTWTLNAPVWTDAQGQQQGAMLPQPGFAIFGGEAGVVTVNGADGEVAASGLQFAANGYTLRGDRLTLSALAGPEVRVGDGSAASAAYVATVENDLRTSDTLRKTGQGTLVLEGVTVAQGGTRVEAGTLWVGQQQALARLNSNVTVLEGATLGGRGRVGGVSVAQGGTLAPGLNTLTVSGNLDLAAGAVYDVAVDPVAGQASRVHVEGSASLAGTVRQVGPASGYAPESTYTILSADMGVRGRFDGVNAQYVFLTPELGYGENTVTLTLRRNAVELEQFAGTPNQRSVVAALNSLPANNALAQSLLRLGQGTDLGALYDSLSGEMQASLSSTLQQSGQLTQQAALRQLRGSLATPTQSPGAPVAQARHGALPASALPSTRPSRLWAEILGGHQELRGDGNAATLRQDVGGLMVGGTHAVGEWRLGGALAYTHGDFSVRGRASSAKVDSYTATLFGGRGVQLATGQLNALLGASHAWHELDSKRQVVLGSDTQSLEADARATTTQVFGELGYALPWRGMTIEPFAGVAWQQLRQRGFTETGGSAALRAERETSDTASTTVGVRAAAPFTLRGSDGTVRGALGWRHAWGDVSPSRTLAFSEGNAFTVAGTPLARDTAVVEAGVGMSVSASASLHLDYAGQFGSRLRDHGLMARYAYRF